MVRRRHEDIFDEVGFLRAHARHADAATLLAAIGVERHALDVVVVCKRDDDIFLRDEVFDVDLGGVDRDLRAPLVAVLLAHGKKLVLDDFVDLSLVGENGFEPVDHLQDLLVLFLNLLAFQTRQTLQTKVEDRLRLLLAELETFHQALTRDVRRAALADRRDDGVEVIERYGQAFEDMSARLGFRQFVLRAPRDDILLVLDVVVQHLFQREHARTAVDEREHDDAEAVLQLRVLVELVQDDVSVRVAAHVDDDAHAAAVGLVVQGRDALDRLVAHELGDLLDETRLVHLIGQLRHDDARAAARRRLDVHARAKLDDAAPRRICLTYALRAEDQSRRREIRPLDDRHKLLNGSIGTVNKHQRAIDDLAHVVWRDVRRHADSDSRRAVRKKLRELRGQHGRLFQGLVVVRCEIHRLLVDVLQHELRDLRHAHLGVAHRCRRITVNRAKVTVTVGEHVAHGKILRHAHDRIVDRAVTMRVVLTEDFADDARRLLVRFARTHARFLHRIEDAAVHRLQTVAHVRQGAGDDDAHGIVDIGILHLTCEIYRNDLPLAKIHTLTPKI